MGHRPSAPPPGNVSSGRPVVVIGAGIAGLTAAWELKRRGWPVVIIERTGRAGGRIDSTRESSLCFEVGMQFYYTAYRESLRLLRETGLLAHRHPVHIRGFMTRKGRITAFDKARPWVGLLGTAGNLRLWRALGRKSAYLVRTDPFNFSHGEACDEVDVADYFRSSVGDAAVDLVARPLTTSYCFTEPEGQSLAMFLRIVRLGAVSRTFVLRNGNDSLPERLASQLEIVPAQATRVEIRADQVSAVRIEKEGREEQIDAVAVVCAVPAPEAAKLFDPSSPLASGLRGVAYSDIVLANLHLDRPVPQEGWVYTFSRDDGHSAAFAIDCRRKCPPAFPGDASVLQAHFPSPLATRLLTSDDQTVIASAISDLETYFPLIRQWVCRATVVRRSAAVPSYTCGAFGRIRAVERTAAGTAGLYLAGDYLRAPLAEGAIRSALSCVERIEANRAGHGGPPRV